jgi:hypothetical protein
MADYPDLAFRARDLPAALRELPEETRKVAKAIYNARLLARGQHDAVPGTLEELKKRGFAV